MVSPEDLLTFAKQLHSQAESAGDLSEVYLRSAISRGYYAVYHKTEIVGNICPDPVGEYRGSHADRIRRMVECPLTSHQKSVAVEIRRIGMKLNQLRDSRNNADYDLGNPIDAKQAETMLITSGRLLNACDRAYKNACSTEIA